MGDRSVDELVEVASQALTELAAIDPTRLTGPEVLELVEATQRLRTMADGACGFHNRRKGRTPPPAA